MSVLNPEVIVILMLDGVSFLLLALAAIIASGIVRQWDITATTPLQYLLEKQSYLASTVVTYVLILKIVLTAYFIFVLDKLALVIPGAMCAAGVLNATLFGPWLLGLKIVNLFLFGFWLALHNYDMRCESLPYTRKKFGLLLVCFGLVFMETALEWLMFQALDPQRIVSCCGSIYSKNDPGFSWKTWPDALHLVFFYGSFVLMFSGLVLRWVYLFAVANLLYLTAAILSLIAFFSRYVYELPTHRCPFCLLQSDYYLIGYLLYLLLLGGVFAGVVVGGLHAMTREYLKPWYGWSMVLNAVYLVIISLYPLIYFLKNDVWLKAY